MSYINEKLIAIEHHAKNFLNHETSANDALRQKYFEFYLMRLLPAIKAIREQAENLYKHDDILSKIKGVVNKGGDPTLILKDVKDILESLN